ncbi:hypothetical protein MNB_SUP05-SYMBIONT-5-696 [hydrothermal vent metagenome]|uniref:Uracil-DNA glycosylase-like domain-containing protein n=1 Tax=hydrothermal vent metagenome TaxID=652676 RepID=A0A1W1E6K8_9ZZZZ
MQDKLNKLYADKWKCLKDNAFKGACNPLLIKVTDEYIEADIKVVIYGQETAGWNKDLCDDFSMEYLLNDYEAYLGNDKAYFDDRDGCYAHSKKRIKRKNKRVFWNRRGFKFFTEQLKVDSDGKSVAFLWNNLSKIGKASKSGKATKCIAELEDKHFNVLKGEFEILKPNVVIFFTGPSRDSIIEEKLEAKIEQFFSSNYKRKQLAKVVFKDKNILGVRTYHPGHRCTAKVRQERYQEIINKIIDKIRAVI